MDKNSKKENETDDIDSKKDKIDNIESKDKKDTENEKKKSPNVNVSPRRDENLDSHHDENKKGMFVKEPEPKMIEDEIKEGDTIELSEIKGISDERNIKQTNELIHDIMAEEEQNIKVNVDEKHNRKFMRKTLIKKIPFSMGNLDVYLHVKYQHINVFLRCAIECLVIFIAFLFPPTLLIMIGYKTEGYCFFQHLSRDSKFNLFSEYLRQSLFVALIYMVFIAASLMTDNLLYSCAFVLSAFGVRVQGGIAETLQILNASKRHIRDMITSFIVFYIAIILISDYTFFSKEKDLTYILLTGFFWFGCISAILFFERFLMNFLTSELRRKSFRGRIWEANYKTYVFKKLAAIAEATPNGKHRVNEVISDINNEYDTGFFLRHNDLDLSSQEQANLIAEGIFGYLEIEKLEYNALKRYFKDNPEEVYSYISGTKVTKETTDFPPIPFESVKTRCIDLYQERMDISRSLYDRDNILRKLDFILIAIVIFFSVIICFILLDVDYKIYVASIGPTIFGFGWIFQDSIKELYRCFVFHLINHHYDCGDRIILDGEELIVVKIDLLYTSFGTMSGKLKYIPNASMFMKNIENIRRSDMQSEYVTICVASNTSFEQINKIKEKMIEFLQKDSKNFTGTVFLKNYEAGGGNMKVTFTIEHSTNFQEYRPRLVRREEMIRALEKILDDSGMTHERCYRISD